MGTCGRETKVARNKISRIRHLELSNQTTIDEMKKERTVLTHDSRA